MLAYPFETAKDGSRSNDVSRQITQVLLYVRTKMKLERLP